MPQRTCQRKGWREARHRGRIILVFGEKPRMLTFSCKENWDRMPTVDNGRFCQKCQHAVVDFTSWDRRSMLAYLELHPDTCGQYRPEQLEPDRRLANCSLQEGSASGWIDLGNDSRSAQAPAPQRPAAGTDTRPRPPSASWWLMQSTPTKSLMGSGEPAHGRWLNQRNQDAHHETTSM